MRGSHRAAFGPLAGAGLSVGLSLLFAVTSSAAPPSLSVVAGDAGIGQTIHATARLSESPDASGEIAFEVFGPDDPTCFGTALAPAPASATVTGEDDYISGEFNPPEAGVYHWSARYSSDVDHSAAESTCSAASIVGKASPVLAGSASDGVVNTGIHDEATLTGGFSPTGEVIFRIYGPTDTACATVLDTDAVPLQDGHAISADFLPQQAGEFRWTATYEGDENNEPANTTCGAVNQASTVNKASPTLGGVATSPVVAGSSITDVATLSAGFDAGGQLVFRAYGPGDGTCSTTPKYEATVAVDGNGPYSPAGFSPGAGLYRWTVSYAGDGNNEAASTTCGAAGQASTVSKASPTLAGVATSAVVGSSITDVATLSSGFEAGGQLVFRAYGPGDATCSTTPKYEATVAVDGNGPYSPAGFSPGAGLYRWTVSYAGDGNNESTSLPCGSVNQVSTVNKVSPTLSGVATSAVVVGSPITDGVTLSDGFEADGQLVFRAYGPGDGTCSTTPKYEATVAVDGNGPYSPAGFSPGAGLYRWTVSYAGDGNNEAAELPCGSTNQASAVGTITPTLAAGATSGTVGDPVTATASIQEGAIPTGQMTFRAFSPDDANCSGAAAFDSTVKVSGIGSYGSAAFVPSQVGTFRWTVSYSGDPNHAPTTVGCGNATSTVSQAKPSIANGAMQRLTVGTSFEITATLQGGYSPTGTIKFEIYRRTAAGCAKPLAVDVVPVTGNDSFHSKSLVAQNPGAYSFVASYSGDAANQGASDPCNPSGQAVRVNKRTPKVKPRARLKGERQISIRALLSGAASPSGVINFSLYRPGDKQCKRKPIFSGRFTVRSNGNYLLAQYFATKPGVYRLSVGYSGDQRNLQYRPNCRGAQQIRIG
jgi:hypothetical protein